MSKYIQIIIGLVLVDFFLFPIEFTFMPGINTKMAMAVVSLVLFAFDMARRHSGAVDKNFLLLVFFATMVSFAMFASVVYNNTNDYVYVTYVVSMLVWLGGAYTAIRYLQSVHGEVTIKTAIMYLAAVCALQCIISLLLDRSHAFYNLMRSLVVELDTFRAIGQGRIYGIGCAFDVAGIRFSAVLVAMGFLLPSFIRENKEKPFLVTLFMSSFGIITIVGNMISRTTLVGFVFALVYIIYDLKLYTFKLYKDTRVVLGWLLGFLSVGTLTVAAAYILDVNFREDFRFGFEGFFSWMETGTWEVHSNNQLFSMFKMPETMHTWIIGDGYFYDTTLDPYYTGKTYKEYYMGTDVGYLRFIYYSGIIGMGVFIMFIYKTAHICMERYNHYKAMFFSLFLLQLVVWVKVATDIFPVLAIFLALTFASKPERNTFAPYETTNNSNEQGTQTAALD